MCIRSRLLAISLTALLVALPLSISRGAVVLNGSFESGLSGWNVVGGEATTSGTAFGIAPTDMTTQANINNAGATAAADNVIEAALNLAAGRLDTLAGGGPPQATTGTAIYQTLTGVLAGDVLSFDWTFVTNENFAAGFPNQNDFAFWSITSVANPGTILYRAADALQPTGQAGFEFKSPTSTVTYNFTSPGDFVLGFGVMNVIDGGGASGLLVDNVHFVPEPSSLSLLGLLAASIFCRRRRS